MLGATFRTIARLSPVFLAAALVAASDPDAFAQVTPTTGSTSPDNTPSIKLGVTIFTNYTYTNEPQLKDSDGNLVNPNSFDVARAYVNITGNLSHLVSFRVTSDIGPRQATSASALPAGSSVSSNLDGSLTIRLKYAYGQISFEDFAPKGSWARLGMLQTPYVDYAEGIYRYRFQGPVFVEREGFLTASDFGLSTHFNFPDNYGDVHVGVYNGEGYTKAETNDQKAFQVRASFRPFPRRADLQGFRFGGFFDADHYVQGGKRRRLLGHLAYEHKYVNLNLEYLDAKDQTSASKPEVGARGFSVWATPKTSVGLEALFRFDRLKPSKDVDARKRRTIVGLAYWFKTEKVGAAVLADYEHVGYDAALARPNETRYALHALFNF